MRWIVLGFCAALAFGGAAHAQQQAVTPDLMRLHDALNLSDSQQGAWRAYTTAIAPDPQQVARHNSTSGMLASLPTPRRIALIEATMVQDVSDFRRQGAAVNAFYSALTPSQQRTFDQQTLPPAGADATRR